LDTQMTLSFLEHLVSLPLSFFQRRAGGDLIMRMNSNATIREILTSGTVSALIDGTLVVAYLGVLLFAHLRLGLLALGLGALQIVAFVASRGRRQELFAEGLHAQAVAQSYQVEILDGMESLKSMGVEGRSVEHYTRLFVDSLNVAIERARLSALVDSVLSAVRLGSPIAILIAGAAFVLQGDLSLGSMLALNALAIGFLTPLATLVGVGEQFILLGSYLARLDDVFGAAPEQSRAGVARAPALSGRVLIEDVSFRYGDNGPLVVRNASVEIEPGQFVAVVGASGSGKSTLASLLIALHRPTSGRISIDGRDLSGLDVGSVREQFGVVVQRPYIFSASVRSNIDLGDPNVPFERVEEAARLAQIHDEIAAMPMGYDTLLSEGGASISGGQRQRVALARALVRRPPILLLDEATSALDAVTEARVEAALRELRATRIVIAHRLSTVMKADLILMLEGGLIVERGVHEELVGKGGRYHQLVTAQLSERQAPWS
ncbi:MAG TPA: peptidase domain-containing ABC transporter, partial [Polyangiaceae bacterium]|nr:peptidase domain-containing ABC transporter [Polyangiaceae bacterium]